MEIGRKWLGAISLICLAVTAIWLVLLIYGIATRGLVETYDQALAYVADRDLLHTLTYANATLITLSVTMLLAGMYVLYGREAPLWAAMGVVFVPIYGLLNLFAYLSQITIVPRLHGLRPASELLLAQMVQAWPGSVVNVLNNLAYAVLGIPSIAFGILLGRRGAWPRVAGILLALSGVANILGMIGIVAESATLGLGSLAGGVLFLAALFPLCMAWLREA
jgi:hypothetical protein